MMTGMMNKMMGGPTTTELTKVETGAIADTEFATPAATRSRSRSVAPLPSGRSISVPHLVDALRSQTQSLVIAAELRPPRAELGTAAAMDAWIDTYRAVRSLTRRDLFVMLTDSAVGSQEEDNLRHLVTNLGVRRRSGADRAVPDVEAHAASTACRMRTGRGSTGFRRW